MRLIPAAPGGGGVLSSAPGAARSFSSLSTSSSAASIISDHHRRQNADYAATYAHSTSFEESFAPEAPAADSGANLKLRHTRTTMTTPQHGDTFYLMQTGTEMLRVRSIAIWISCYKINRRFVVFVCFCFLLRVVSLSFSLSPFLLDTRTGVFPEKRGSRRTNSCRRRSRLG